MKVISVNIGVATPVQIGERQVQSGIRKQAVTGRVVVGTLGLDGDQILNRKHHGGPDQAVYIYTDQDYDHWAQELGEALAPGTFGENLTLSGFESAGVRVGERLQIGPVQLEVTSPRIPCSTLAAVMGDPGFVKRFRQARRPGLYLRVITGGEVGVGDPVQRLAGPPDAPTIAEFFELSYRRAPSRADLERLLAAPIDSRSRAGYSERLAQLG
jgi:MOSC domain-containing protein YiiM